LWRLKRWWLLLYLGTFCLEARSESLEGIVRNSGSGVNQVVEVVVAKATNGDRLCPGEVSARIKKLSGMTLEISGDWKIGKSGDRQCFEVQGFHIKRHLSGRPPLVGTLKDDAGTYAVVTEDGKKHVLGDASSGLKKLAGKKVILDIKSFDATGEQSSNLKVISYAAYPE
jgi:hypothetical protein